MNIPPLPAKMSLKKVALASLYAFSAFVIFQLLIFIIGIVVGITCLSFMAGYKLF
jgi:hypothetical protein